MSTDYAILTKSCAESQETIKWEDGNEYPLIKMEISSDSHPFYTGKTKLVDTAGRIDKFRNKYQKLTSKNTGLNLIFALNYGSRNEISRSRKFGVESIFSKVFLEH